jgi:hypothetical protein
MLRNMIDRVWAPLVIIIIIIIGKTALFEP